MKATFGRQTAMNFSCNVLDGFEDVMLNDNKLAKFSRITER